MNFYEIHETVHSVYLVLEYLAGGELMKKLKKRKQYSESTVRKIMKNLLLGLEFIHNKGVMHRDLKPENLILRYQKKLYSLAIADFGLSSFVDVNEYLFRRCGTPGYVAPEIISNKQGSFYDTKCDIFSAGVIFYILYATL